MANERARQLRSNMTEAEKALWQRLRILRPLSHHFRRQVPMGPYIVDFCCHRAKLVIEVDGGQHASADNVKLDAKRTMWLENEDYRVMRFWNNEVMSNLEGVMDVILKALTAHPTPTPPPQGEGLLVPETVFSLSSDNG